MADPYLNPNRETSMLFRTCVTAARTAPLLRSLILMAILVVAAGCSGPPQEHRATAYIFGTLLDLDVISSDPKLAERAVTELDHDFQRMHRDWHGWKPLGELYELNRHIAAGESGMPVSPSLAQLIEQSQAIYRASDGLFNPAIGRLIGMWGFHQDDRPNGPPPSRAAIAELLSHKPGMDDLRIEGGRVLSRNPYVELDFGGFAKGYALNLAQQHLRQMGIENAMLNAGGDLCGMGRHGDRPWRVGIRHPQGQGVLAAVDIDESECVLTSGNYERYLEHKGIRYAHIIDPRSGQPVAEIASATVIDRNGGLADAAATALTVAGSQGWYQLARRMKLKYVMLVDEAGTVYMNPAMAKRIQFEGTSKPGKIVISPPL
jgi:thiamine biosynthesis lipoprotein